MPQQKKYDMNKDGLKEAKKDIRSFAEGVVTAAESLDGSLDEIFDTDFMMEYTKAKTLHEFMEGAGISLVIEQKIPDVPDAFVAANTTFETWQEMLVTASILYVQRNLRRP